MSKVSPRKGMPSPRLSAAEFRARFLSQFPDPAFETLAAELDKIATAAWEAYDAHRKSPHTRKAGSEFADPNYELSVDWLAARAAIADAQRRHDERGAPAILLINGSSRSEHTCPGEMSKSYRLIEIARDVFAASSDVEVRVLDLSRLASEYGRHIHPCKACFSTAAALCHCPCSCYPNYSLGQTQDWMNDIYPLWVAAHGIMIVTPVSGLLAAQAHDGPTGLRRWWQSRSDPDPGQERRTRQGDRARRLGLPSPSRRPRVLRIGAWGRRRGGERPPQHFRLALLHAPLSRWASRRARPLHRLLEALRHQPCRTRCRHRHPGGSAHCRAHAARGGARQARRHICYRRGESAAAATKIDDDLSRAARGRRPRRQRVRGGLPAVSADDGQHLAGDVAGAARRRH